MSAAARAVRARYRLADEPGWPPDHPVLAGLLAHRSVRAFLPDPLPPGTVETLVAAAQSAATSSNTQSWSVVAVEDPDRRARLAALSGDQRFMAEAPLLLVWLVDFARVTAVGARAGQRLEAPDYVESLLLGAIDASLAAQNAVVALEALGLGAVYVGGIRNRPEAVAAELGLPPRAFALFGLSVGRPDPTRATAVKPRLPQAVVLFRERYGDSAPSTELAAYDERLRAFQQEQAMAETGWTAQVLRRLAGPASMGGRHRLREVLGQLGFPLR